MSAFLNYDPFIDFKKIDIINQARKKLSEQGFLNWPSPWIEQTIDLLDKQGHWADYAAWKNWMNEQIEHECLDLGNESPSCGCCSCVMARWWDDLGEPQLSHLYAIMVMVAQEVSEYYEAKDKT